MSKSTLSAKQARTVGQSRVSVLMNSWLMVSMMRSFSTNCCSSSSMHPPLSGPTAPRRYFAGGSFGEELFDARPQLGPDAVGQLDVPLAEHHGDSARVEPGDPRFLDHCREVNAGLTDHSPEESRSLGAVAQSRRQQGEDARTVQPMR